MSSFIHKNFSINYMDYLFILFYNYLIWTNKHQSYNIFQRRCEEKVVKIIKRCFNSYNIEEEWSLIVINFRWATIESNLELLYFINVF